MIRRAVETDIAPLMTLINRAYRPQQGEAQGWTHESDWVDGDRMNASALYELLDDPQQQLWVLTHATEGCVQGCVLLTAQPNHAAHVAVSIGLLTVDVALQGQGLAKQLLAFAEQQAVLTWSAQQVSMSVLQIRTALLAFYTRHGYVYTGEQQPYPIGQGVGRPKQDLNILMLKKVLI
ncbi:MAG: hypothetical protein RLY58_774 [Pseudomonadota bacterium]|jgi:ribosomal protein S18 acetylase RimI-like enzyme